MPDPVDPKAVQKLALDLSRSSLDPALEDLEAWLLGQLQQREAWALLYCDLQGFSLYNQLYGPVAGAQMLRTWRAIQQQQADSHSRAASLLHLGGDEFLIFTEQPTGLSTAQGIVAAWQAVSPQFYTQRDRERAFLMATDRRGISGRWPLVQVNVGLVLGPLQTAAPLAGLLSAAIEANLRARQPVNPQRIALRSLEAQRLELPAEAALCPPRILVVEPDAALAFLLQTTLELRGHWVMVTSSASEALGLCQRSQGRPDLMIVDLFEPGQTLGLELCQSLSRDPELRHICLVAMVSDADREEVLNAGANLFVPKPFEIHDLLSWVDRLVQLNAQVVDLPGVWPTSHLSHPIQP